MSSATCVVNKELLDFYYPDRLTYTGPSKRGHIPGVPAWLEKNIKYGAECLVNGKSVDKIIDWIDPRIKNEGNHFQNLNIFFESMDVAAKYYSISSPYKTTKFVSLGEAVEIIQKSASGITAKELVEEYNLFNRNVVYNLRRDFSNKINGLTNILRGLEIKKLVEFGEFESDVQPNIVKYSDSKKKIVPINQG